MTPIAESPHGLWFSFIAHLASPLPLSAYIPQQDGGGVPGEIFRSDVTGDGTVGDLLPGTLIGNTGKYSTSKLTQNIAYYNQTFAGQLTPAGRELVISSLFSQDQLSKLGAYAPLICSNVRSVSQPCQGLPGNFAQATWLKSIDLRSSRPFQAGERVKLRAEHSHIQRFQLCQFRRRGKPAQRRAQRRSRHFAE